MTSLDYFQLANAEQNATCKLVELSEERIDLFDFVVIFNIVLKWVFQLWLLIFLLLFYGFFEFLNETTMFLFVKSTLNATFRDGSQIRQTVIFELNIQH